MNFEVVMQYIPMFFQAVLQTLTISVSSILLGTVLGIIIYLMKTSSLKVGAIRPLNIVSSIFIEVMRGTPILLQILVCYVIFGMLPISRNLPGNTSSLLASIIAISLNSSVYIAEIIRAGIQSVSRGQLQAARSLGMSKSMAMIYIIMPQAIKNIIPALGNEFVSIVKGSSMGYVLGVAELTFTAKVVQGATYQPLSPLLVSALFYMCLTFILGRIVSNVEKRMQRSDA